MSKNRIKISLPLITTRTEAEAVMNDLANTANNRRKLAARLDMQILAAQDAAAPGLAACDADLQAKSDALRVWAEAHPEEFPKARKSIEFLSGTLGFRTGTPKVALVSRVWTWEKVLSAIIARGFKFIRIQEEVDREAILAFHAEAPDKPEVAVKVLAPIGVKIVQDESFYVEPKLTDADQN
jgi:phage host-nuclease inhibitor protein Gam